MAHLVGIISLAAVRSIWEECHLPVKTLLEGHFGIKPKSASFDNVDIDTKEWG